MSEIGIAGEAPALPDVQFDLAPFMPPAQTIDGIRTAEVAGITAMIEDGTINAWRVRIRLSFGVQERIHE